MFLAPLFLMLATPAPGVDTPPQSSDVAEHAPLRADEVEGDEVAFQGVIIQERVIIRVPATRTHATGFSRPVQNQRSAAPLPVEWKEKRAPRCVPMRSIVGVQFTQKSSIDLITRERQRLRAALDDECRAVDFYAGFYMIPPKDGNLCADRDIIHARSGARCDVEKFSLLVPVQRKR